MEFKLEFNMDNAAFVQYPEGEVMRILENTIAALLIGQVYSGILDHNGNIIGKWSIDE